MVDFLLSVETTFDASHLHPEDREHAHSLPHSHVWDVRVTIAGVIDPTTGSAGKHMELDEALGALRHEVEDQSLNEVIPQVIPTLEGVGMWIIDRLLPVNSKIVEVEVRWVDLRRSCLIRRQPR